MLVLKKNMVSLESNNNRPYFHPLILPSSSFSRSWARTKFRQECSERRSRKMRTMVEEEEVEKVEEERGARKEEPREKMMAWGVVAVVAMVGVLAAAWSIR